MNRCMHGWITEWMRMRAEPFIDSFAHWASCKNLFQSTLKKISLSSTMTWAEQTSGNW